MAIDNTKDLSVRQKHVLPILIILGSWFIINLVQSVFTGLFDDEALFWMYGERLDWGFYEHPPMVGLMIKMGYSIFHNELGVRLFFVMASTLSLYLLMILSDVRNYLLFAALCLSIGIIQAGGFIAAPDVALVLFTLLFFLVYRNLIERDTIPLALLWGVIMAAMIYSKYNGILVIFFTLLSNLKLLRKKSFYLAALVAILCFAPHIIWSFRHGHPTIYYHLIERNFEQYKYFKYFFSFIIGQFIIYGPFMAAFLFWFSFTHKPADQFERSLKFTAIGIVVFFLLFTFQGQVEPNWTVPAFLPMLILTYKGIEKRLNLHKLIYILAAVGFVLMLFLRIYLVYDFLKLPRKFVNLSELYYWRDWAKEMEKRANGRPVLFISSYQRAAKYSFYTGKTAHSVDGFDGHRTQYYYWEDLEKNLQGKEVLVAGYTDWMYIPGKQSYKAKNGVVTFWGIAENFRSNYNVTLETRISSLKFPASTYVKIPVRIFNPGHDTLRFDQDMDQPSNLVYHIHLKDKYVVYQETAVNISHLLIPGASSDTLMTVKTPDEPGKYYFWVSIQTGWMMAGRNQNYQIMEIY